MKKNSKTIGIVILVLVVALILFLFYFQWQGQFLGPARASEAKTALASLYAAEKAYFAEHKKYSYNIKDITLIQEGKNHRYVIFFPKNCREKFADQNELRFTHGTLFPEFESWYSQNKEFLATIEATCLEPTQGFTALAAGIVMSNGNLDMWSVDQDRKLIHLKDGTYR